MQVCLDRANQYPAAMRGGVTLIKMADPSTHKNPEDEGGKGFVENDGKGGQHERKLKITPYGGKRHTRGN